MGFKRRSRPPEDIAHGPRSPARAEGLRGLVANLTDENRTDPEVRADVRRLLAILAARLER